MCNVKGNPRSRIAKVVFRPVECVRKHFTTSTSKSKEINVRHNVCALEKFPEAEGSEGGFWAC